MPIENMSSYSIFPGISTRISSRETIVKSGKNTYYL